MAHEEPEGRLVRVVHQEDADRAQCVGVGGSDEVERRVDDRGGQLLVAADDDLGHGGVGLRAPWRLAVLHEVEHGKGVEDVPLEVVVQQDDAQPPVRPCVEGAGERGTGEGREDAEVRRGGHGLPQEGGEVVLAVGDAGPEVVCGLVRVRAPRGAEDVRGRYLPAGLPAAVEVRLAEDVADGEEGPRDRTGRHVGLAAAPEHVEGIAPGLGLREVAGLEQVAGAPVGLRVPARGEQRPRPRELGRCEPVVLEEVLLAGSLPAARVLRPREGPVGGAGRVKPACPDAGENQAREVVDGCRAAGGVVVLPEVVGGGDERERREEVGKGPPVEGVPADGSLVARPLVRPGRAHPERGREIEAGEAEVTPVAPEVRPRAAPGLAGGVGGRAAPVVGEQGAQVPTEDVELLGCQAGDDLLPARGEGLLVGEVPGSVREAGSWVERAPQQELHDLGAAPASGVAAAEEAGPRRPARDPGEHALVGVGQGTQGQGVRNHPDHVSLAQVWWDEVVPVDDVRGCCPPAHVGSSFDYIGTAAGHPCP